MVHLRLAAASLIVSGLMSAAVSAAPILEQSYFVRPALRVGGGAIQDGLVTNGATQATQTQSVSGTSRSTVSLVDGTVKMFAEEGSSNEVGLQTFGSFGERLTIRNGAGTNWNLGFGIEGEIFGELGPAAPGAELPVVFYDLSIVVFDAGIATSADFYGLATDPCFGQDPLNCIPRPAPRAFQYQSNILDIPIEDYDPTASSSPFYIDVADSIFASVLLENNTETLDVFVFTNVFYNASAAGVGSGVESYVLDFENTVTYTQDFAPGVEVFSSSGEFLGLDAPPPVDPNEPTPVAAPGVLSLFGLGLLALLRTRRRCS
tara:strand:+ start:2231 stop:3184 length:954 start_codon:yes stop_codon:yes gene_type:complete